MSANGLYYIINVLLGLLNRRFLIRIMGIDYQGVNGLFASVLTVLEMAELGIGTAIIYHLYKPLAENDKNKIKSIMGFYKRCYRVIAIVIAIIGCIICTNIEFFVGSTSLQLNLRIVFLLMLADVIGTYTLAYKRSILYADQKNYIVANVNTGFVICYNIAQLSILYLTRNYYLYLFAKLIFRIVANVIINVIVNKQYPYLKTGFTEPLDKAVLQDIKQKVKGLMCHKIGTFVVNGTDNIFISKLIGLSIVGIYANYNYVITAINSLLNQIVDGATGSVGNLLVKADDRRSLLVFKEMNLLNLFVSTSAISVFSVAVDNFIMLFFGTQYVLDNIVIIILLANMIAVNQKRVWGIMKTAAGIQYEDRFVPLYESIINLIMSYVFFRIFGLAGIFMGTLCTHFGVFFFTFPILVGEKLFGITYRWYLAYMAQSFLFQAVVVFGSFFIVNKLTFGDLFWQMIIKSIIAGIISVFSFVIVFFNTTEFKGLLKRIQGVIHAKYGKNKE